MRRTQSELGEITESCTPCVTSDNGCPDGVQTLCELESSFDNAHTEKVSEAE